MLGVPSVYLSVHISTDLPIPILSIKPSIYLSIYLVLSIDGSIDRSIYRSIDLSIYLNYIYPYPYPYVSIYLSRLSVDFSTDPFVYLPTYQSTNLPIYLFIFFSTYLVAYRSTYLSVCLTIHSSIHPGILLSTSYQPPPYLPIPACGGPHSARGKHAHAHYMRNRRYNVHCITGCKCALLTDVQCSAQYISNVQYTLHL